LHHNARLPRHLISTLTYKLEPWAIQELHFPPLPIGGQNTDYESLWEGWSKRLGGKSFVDHKMVCKRKQCATNSDTINLTFLRRCLRAEDLVLLVTFSLPSAV
jgi:hypothetical protein